MTSPEFHKLSRLLRHAVETHDALQGLYAAALLYAGKGDVNLDAMVRTAEIALAKVEGKSS